METPIINYRKIGPWDEEDDKLENYLFNIQYSPEWEMLYEYLKFRTETNLKLVKERLDRQHKEYRLAERERLVLSYYWPKDTPLHQLDLSKNVQKSDVGETLWATNKGRVLLLTHINEGECYRFYAQFEVEKRNRKIIHFNPYGRNKDDSSEFIVKKIYL